LGIDTANALPLASPEPDRTQEQKQQAAPQPRYRTQPNRGRQ
jgi:hypothetical protein